jgi:hypothetical protein
MRRVLLGVAAVAIVGGGVFWLRATSEPEVATSPAPAAEVEPVAPPPPPVPVRAPPPDAGPRAVAFAIPFDGGTCSLDTDCPPGQACLGKGWAAHPSCVAGNCLRDPDCRPGEVCRLINRPVSGPPTRRCTSVGDLPEGADCPMQPWEGERCGPGLLCVLGTCLKPCTDLKGTECGPDATCVDGPNGPGCHPSCAHKACPEGERCTGFGLLMSCMKEVGTNCRVTPCARGQKCIQSSDGHVVRSWCQAVCDPLRGTSCAAGQVCGAMGSLSLCYKACEPDAGGCAANEDCAPVAEDGSSWGCRPTF